MARCHSILVGRTLHDERLDMESDTEGQRTMHRQLLETAQTDHYRICPQLCHTCRTAWRRTIQDYGTKPLCGNTEGNLLRRAFCHDAHLCPLQFLGNSNRHIYNNVADGHSSYGCADGCIALPHVPLLPGRSVPFLQRLQERNGRETHKLSEPYSRIEELGNSICPRPRGGPPKD